MKKVFIEGLSLNPIRIFNGDIIIAEHIESEVKLLAIRPDNERVQLYSLDNNFNVWLKHGGFDNGSSVQEVERLNGIKIIKIIPARTYNMIIKIEGV